MSRYAADPRERGKPVEKPANGTLVPAKNGGMIRHGSQKGSNGPGSGRPPNEWGEYCRELITNPKLRAKLKRELTGDEPLNYSALRLVVEYAVGKVTEKVELNATTLGRVLPDERTDIYLPLLKAGDAEAGVAATRTSLGRPTRRVQAEHKELDGMTIRLNSCAPARKRAGRA